MSGHDKGNTGETDIEQLLAQLNPQLRSGEFVFCTFEHASYGDFTQLKPVAVMQEEEGLTLVIPLALADKNQIFYSSIFKQISLTVHSSLDAVGLTAAFAQALANKGVSANIFAGFYHDHIFVQQEHADTAMEALAELSNNAHS